MRNRTIKRNKAKKEWRETKKTVKISFVEFWRKIYQGGI